MRQLTSLETNQITGATLDVRGTTIDVPNNFDIPANEYIVIEQTFQKVINKEINFYQAANHLKELHICKYDVTNYFNSLVSKLGSQN